MRLAAKAACIGPFGSALIVAALAFAGPALAATNGLKVVNKCKAPVWIQQDNLPGAAPIVKIDAGQSHDYSVPINGAASTRFWPKLGCDAAGNTCAIGQSSNPCPKDDKGCAPPVDSKLEVTWGCLTGDKTCAKVNPSKPALLDDNTWLNASLVDGFTLPFDVTVTSADQSAGCTTAATCPAVDADKSCPTDVDLSTDGYFPAYKNQDLRVQGPKGVAGCFSPCGKLTYAKTFGGHQLDPGDPAAAFYCCAPVSGTNPFKPPLAGLNPGLSPDCNAGPAPKTSYVAYVHKACSKSVYGFAYDDAVGLRVCKGATTLTFTLCP